MLGGQDPGPIRDDERSRGNTGNGEVIPSFGDVGLRGVSVIHNYTTDGSSDRCVKLARDKSKQNNEY